MAEAVVKAIRENLQQKIASTLLTLGELRVFDVKSYETGKPRMTLSFSLIFSLTSHRADVRDARLTVTGECLFDLTTRVALEPDVKSHEVTWSDADGKQHRARLRLPAFSIIDFGQSGLSLDWQDTYHRRSNAGGTVFSVYGNTEHSPVNINLLGNDAGLFGPTWEEF